MPPHARNLKRGSEVVRRWKARQDKLVSAFGALQDPRNKLSIAQVARQFGVSYDFLQKRWRRWVAADRMGDQGERNAALEHRGGGHNRVFLPSEESELAYHLASEYSVVTPSIIRDVAVQFHSTLERKKGQHHILRSKIHPPFAASDSFVAGFRQRQELPLQATKLDKEVSAKVALRDKEGEALDFILSVHQAIMDFGADMVWNADEVSSNCSHSSYLCSIGIVDRALDFQPTGSEFNPRRRLMSFCIFFALFCIRCLYILSRHLPMRLESEE